MLCAEIQLLYKAKSVRPRDQADFNQSVPALDATTREWLATALEIAHPGHAWVARLRAASAD